MLTISCSQTCMVTPLEGFPSAEKGYDQGVSACYATCIGDQLIMAGGANFADKPVAEGGRKCYYKGIYVAAITDGKTLDWQSAGELPEPMAYGSTVRHHDEMIIAGGMSAEGPLDCVYGISLVDGKTSVRELPSLPIPMYDTAAAIDGEMMYVGGGQTDGAEVKRVFSLNLGNESAGWREVNTYNGNASVQPVAFVSGGKLSFMGGFTTLSGCAVFEGPSGGAIAQTENGRLYVAGGVNHRIFLDAISGRYELVDKKDYLLKDPEWYKFDGRLRMYNPHNGSFSIIITDKNLARAGASLVAYKNKYLFSIGGELKPGVRSALVTRCELKVKE